MSAPVYVGFCPEHGPITAEQMYPGSECCRQCIDVQGAIVCCTGPGADLALRMHAALSEIADDPRQHAAPERLLGAATYANGLHDGITDGVRRAAVRAREALGRKP